MAVPIDHPVHWQLFYCSVRFWQQFLTEYQHPEDTSLAILSSHKRPHTTIRDNLPVQPPSLQTKRTFEEPGSLASWHWSLCLQLDGLWKCVAAILAQYRSFHQGNTFHNMDTLKKNQAALYWPLRCVSVYILTILILNYFLKPHSKYLVRS